MKCADTLKNIRQQCLLSQKDFADALGVSFSTVNRWENGKTIPNYKDLKKISDYWRHRHGSDVCVGNHLFPGAHLPGGAHIQAVYQ